MGESETTEMPKIKITKDMTLGETAQRYPETAEVFSNHGLHCFGCPMATMETIEEGALGHMIDVNQLLKELNQAVEKNSEPGEGSEQGLGKETRETTLEPAA